jgi:hypothetical protein
MVAVVVDDDLVSSSIVPSFRRGPMLDSSVFKDAMLL